MDEIFRTYIDSDYSQCEELVNKAWGFDRIIIDEDLCELAKCIYTKGSVLGSNYREVIEVNGTVVGFIFGLNEKAKRPGRNILFSLSVLWRIIRIKSKKEKSKLFSAMQIHEKNRTNIVKRGRSEIVLFVIDEKYQGRGYGKHLWKNFLTQCEGSKVSSILVEANKLGASSFYELLGFQHLENFDSPLHELAAKGGQACMYEFTCR